MSLRIQPGAFIYTSLDPLKDPPKWCGHLNIKNPIVHCLKFRWKFLAFLGPQEATIIKSHAFCLGEPWLKANLVLEIIGYKPALHIEVPEEHVARVIGSISASVAKYIVFDSIFCEANVVNGNRWTLSRNKSKCSDPVNTRDGRLRSFTENCDLFDVLVYIEVLIIDHCRELKHKSKITKDIALSLLDEESFDITLQVGDIRRGAHKFMLSARSPVLKAMLATDMLEGNTGVIELKDMSVPAADAFLSFVYSARIVEKELFETAEELLAAANKYDMPDLHAVCENALLKMITVENGGRLLLLATLHSALELKKDALNFVKRNKTKVTATDDWKEVVAAYPHLILEQLID